MNGNMRNAGVKAVMVLVGLVAAVGSMGCDQTWVPGIGYVDPWYTSAYYGVPDATYYDPTSEIQDVIQYRQDAMAASADGWGEYIMQ